MNHCFSNNTLSGIFFHELCTLQSQQIKRSFINSAALTHPVEIVYPKQKQPKENTSTVDRQYLVCLNLEKQRMLSITLMGLLDCSL